MRMHVRYQQDAIPGIVEWRENQPGNRDDRDALLEHYVALVCREAYRRTKKSKPPWDFAIHFSGTTRLRVQVTKLRRGEYEVLILGLV